MSSRRRNAEQPPALSTTLSAIHRFGSHLAGHTPPSATTLSSPFTSYNPGTYSPAAGPALPHTSTRTPNGTYNPQQWGAGGAPIPARGGRYVVQQGSSGSAPRAVGLEGDLPPPPYSPRREEPNRPNTSPADDHLSPALTISPTATSSRYNTPVSAATTISPLGSNPTYQTTSPRQLSQTSPYSSGPAAYAVASPHSLPPPPPSDQRARSASRTRPDHVQVGPNQIYGNSVGFSQHSMSPETLHANQAIMLNPNTTFDGPSALSYAGYNGRPPASRRAASTGAIGITLPPALSPDGNFSPDSSHWRPGMPLPPPPPGPPPNSRSQSMNRTMDSSPRNFNNTSPSSNAPPPTRRPTNRGPRLPPVPPTPSDWVDEEAQQLFATSPPAHQSRQLHLETSETVTAGPSEDTAPHLVRSTAVRERSAMGIRERRSESRSGKGRMTEAVTVVKAGNNTWAGELEHNNIKPADLVFPSDSGIQRRCRTVTKNTPRSARSSGNGEAVLGSADAIHSTPSPDALPTRRVTPRPGSAGIPSRSLRTPPPQPVGLDVQMTPNGRPLSHILHTPITGPSMPPPLMPHRPPSEQSTGSSVELQRSSVEFGRSSTDKLPRTDDFAKAAMARHTSFAQAEAAATSDSERVHLFAAFIVSESRLRRDKYASAIDAMGSEILELTRDLFRPSLSLGTTTTTPTVGNAGSKTPRSGPRSGPASPVPRPLRPISASSSALASPSLSGDTPYSSHRGSLNLALHDSFTPSTSSSSSARQDSAWPPPAVYMPSLSPIPSMSVSIVSGPTTTHHAPHQPQLPTDELSSRGRPASRWWEAGAGAGTSSQSGSIYNGGTRGLERSKRESKYMGLPLREWEDLASLSGAASSPGTIAAGPSTVPTAQYLPEKVGWHDGSTLGMRSPTTTTTIATGMDELGKSTPSGTRQSDGKLDVSRLVTLPPPYPRHYPAVKNNHPSLGQLRNVVRGLNELGEVRATRERFTDGCATTAAAAAQEAARRQEKLRVEISRKVSTGTMSYAEAAREEAAAAEVMVMATRGAGKREFESFQTEAMTPLHELLTERIALAERSAAQVRAMLPTNSDVRNGGVGGGASGAVEGDPLEEGDEKPELLEKLTLLKWMFEAREALETELFELLSERNERYKQMVVAPYEDRRKIDEVEGFFAQDGQERERVRQREAMRRWEALEGVVEDNVRRGVEVQCSVFWDVAPGIMEVVARVVSSVGREVRTDRDGEAASDPEAGSGGEDQAKGYRFSQQYLWEVLCHAEKSAYQFIEGQINLLCLLHEIKSGVVRQRGVMKAVGTPDRDANAVDSGALAEQEERLTRDLKEKVATVEKQWREAMGTGVKECKAKVKEWLIDHGGWDGMEEDD